MNAPFGVLVGFVVLVLCLGYGRAILRVLGLRLRADLPSERIGPADVPDDVRALLETESRELLELGFEPLAFVRTPCLFDGVDRPGFARLFQHPGGKSFAALSLEGTSRSRPCEVTFTAQADEGRRVETPGWPGVQHHAACDKHVMIDARTVALGEQWELHQQAVAARLPDFAPRDISADELLVEARGSHRCMIASGIERGLFAPAGDGLARFRLRHAIHTVVTSTREDKRRRAALAKRGAAEPTPSDVTAEVWAHQRREEAERSRRSGWALKLGLFALSMVAAVVAFGMSLSFETLAILLGVVFAHELGHALAMKAFGYRNLQILFIPFFGAVASGSKRDVPAWQEIVVLLAGPLPGIVVGTALYLAVDPATAPLLSRIAETLLLLNYFNLLPIVPLDGGRILNVALFDRRPNLQLGFAALSGLALYALGATTQETVLRFLGLGMVLGIPTQWKNSRLLAGARRRLAEPGAAQGAPDPLRALYTELRQPRFDSLNAESKYQLVTSLIDRLVRRPAGAGLAALSVVGWLVIMILPLGVVGYKQAEATRRGTWTARIAAAASPAEEASLRIAAARELVDLDPAEARHQLEPALPKLKALGDKEGEANAFLLLARCEGDDPASAERHLRRALDLREELFGVQSLEVAEVLQAFPFGPESDRVDALVRTLRLIAIYEDASARPGVAAPLVRAYEREAQLREERGDSGRAERALGRALEVAHARADAEHERLQREAAGELTSFYFAHERYGDARAFFAVQTKSPGDAGPDECWLPYFENDAAASARCFAELRARQAKATNAELADWLGLELLLDQAAAETRAGDAAAARRSLARAREVYEAQTGQPFQTYLAKLSGTAGFGTLREREESRRRAEVARALAPLLAAVADAAR